MLNFIEIWDRKWSHTYTEQSSFSTLTVDRNKVHSLEPVAHCELGIWSVVWEGSNQQSLIPQSSTTLLGVVSSNLIVKTQEKQFSSSRNTLKLGKTFSFSLGNLHFSNQKNVCSDSEYEVEKDLRNHLNYSSSYSWENIFRTCPSPQSQAPE